MNGVLKVSTTHKGKIFVECDFKNGKPPVNLSYITTIGIDKNGKNCLFYFNGDVCVKIVSEDGEVVWKIMTTSYHMPDCGVYPALCPTAGSKTTTVYIPAINIDGVFHPNPNGVEIAPGDPFYVISNELLYFHEGANLESQWRSFKEGVKNHTIKYINIENLTHASKHDYDMF